jgi:hypothetical protein
LHAAATTLPAVTSPATETVATIPRKVVAESHRRRDDALLGMFTFR